LDEAEVPFGFQLNVSRSVKPFVAELETYKTIAITARSSQDSLCTIGLNLLMEDGKVYSANVQLTNNWKEIAVPLTEFRSGTSLLLPNSYPGRFLEGLQITADSKDRMKINGKQETKFEIESIVLKK
jgi:hypothetical protein